jgi:hypothetical protein
MKSEKQTLIKFCRIIGILTPIYGSECWNLTKRHIGRMEIAGMRFLRALRGVPQEMTNHNRIEPDGVELSRIQINTTGQLKIRKFGKNIIWKHNPVSAPST